MDDSNDTKMLKSEPIKICTLQLSFLDMKEVVATSLLSTRWRDLWASQPVLNFDDSFRKTKLKNGVAKSKRFMNFVDRALLFHDGSTVRKLQISCFSSCDSDRIDAWLRVAGRRQFQEVHFELFVNSEIEEWPYLLFSSPITVLKIEVVLSDSFHDRVQIPIAACYSPPLKTLFLQSVKLPEGNSDGELVFSNPTLENLTFEECVVIHLNVLNISTYRLKNLVFRNNIDSMGSCQIMICTPNLTTIDIEGFNSEKYCLGSLSSLSCAKFGFCLPKAVDLFKVLDCVSCPTTLEMYHYSWLEGDAELRGKLNREFTNIRCLNFYCWGHHRESNCYLLNLLNICPCLETLGINVYDIEELEEECLPLITFTHLKYVEIGRLMVHGNKLKFLQFLLKNAVILERLVIRMDVILKDFQAKHELGVKIHSL